MIGGETDVVKHLTPVFKTLAPGRREYHVPQDVRTRIAPRSMVIFTAVPNGAGHFVKMIHNGIEYGLMQAYAEGFDILRNANANDLPEDHRYDFKVADIAEVWRRGRYRVVASRSYGNGSF